MRDKKQLFCYPYAGGSASFFDQIERELNEIEVIKCEYSGHGVRHAEAFYRDFDELADDMFRQFLQNYNGGEYALFGYSMGTITLIEVLERILSYPVRPPNRVFLAAHEPHSKSELTGFEPKELDEWVKARTIQFGGVPKQLLNNQTYWRTYLPLYRADYSIIRQYRFENLKLDTKTPASVFYSETDTPLKEMRLWKNYFTGICEFYTFQGFHFFIKEHYKEMAKLIDQDFIHHGE